MAEKRTRQEEEEDAPPAKRKLELNKEEAIEAAIAGKEGQELRSTNPMRYIGTEAHKAEKAVIEKLQKDFVSKVVYHAFWVLPQTMEMKVCMGGEPIAWGMWMDKYEEAEKRYLAAGIDATIERHKEWFLLFDTCARNVCVHYKGSFEVQLLLHVAIYRDLMDAYGGKQMYMRGLRILADRMNSEPHKPSLSIYDVDESIPHLYFIIIEEACRRLEHYHTPVIHNRLTYYSGCRFAIEKPVW